MSAVDLLNFLTQVLFVVLGLISIRQVLLHRRRATMDTALLFGPLGLVILQTWTVNLLQLPPNPFTTRIAQLIIIAIPFILVRLLEDYAGTRKRLAFVTALGGVASLALIFSVSPPLPGWITLTVVTYLVLGVGVVSLGFLNEARSTSGAIQRRLIMICIGSGMFAALLFVAGARLVFPGADFAWNITSRLCGLASASAYFLGFAPPTWLRRIWQFSALQEFFLSTSDIIRITDTAKLTVALEQSITRCLGAAGAYIGLWNEAQGKMMFFSHPIMRVFPNLPSFGLELQNGKLLAPPNVLWSTRAFEFNKAIFTADVLQEPTNDRRLYEQTGIRALLAVPMQIEERRLGIVVAHTHRSPLFAEDDLELLEVLAAHCAVVLECHRLLEEENWVKAREDATLLRDDFLSAAAHDLRTPLTGIMGQAQLLHRQIERRGSITDNSGLQLIIDESKRMNALVAELLDASRVEGQRLGVLLERLDLVDLVRSVAVASRSNRHNYVVEAETSPIMGEFDRLRIAQLMDNLLDNATKYTPNGGDIKGHIRQDSDNQVSLSVADQGIGIPHEDLSNVFDRFYRGSNVNDRRFSGMGLGLYICRGIVEAHGGKIWATNVPEGGTIFHITLPVVAKQSDKELVNEPHLSSR
ncbi:MAG: Sensor histidine kinase WalK [Nitrospira sp.]|nr:Sensor histidine kinase WalK [Nitrospira sp.]